MTAALVLSLSACGFQLRGHDLVNSGRLYAITGAAANTQFAEVVRRELADVNVLTDASGSADVTIELLSVRRQQVDGAVTAEAMLLEQAVRLDVEYRVLGAGQTVITPDQRLSRQRYFRLDRRNLLGTAAVKEEIAAGLEQELAAQLLRNLNVLQQSLAAADGD